MDLGPEAALGLVQNGDGIAAQSADEVGERAFDVVDVVDVGEQEPGAAFLSTGAFTRFLGQPRSGGCVDAAAFGDRGTGGACARLIGPQEPCEDELRQRFGEIVAREGGPTRGESVAQIEQRTGQRFHAPEGAFDGCLAEWVSFALRGVLDFEGIERLPGRRGHVGSAVVGDRLSTGAAIKRRAQSFDHVIGTLRWSTITESRRSWSRPPTWPESALARARRLDGRFL